MRTATTIAQWVVRLGGMTLVALGLLFWTGRALGLIPLHMAVGASFVLGLLALVGLAAGAGLRPVLVVLAGGYALMILVFGMVQTRLWPGPGHWMVQLAHLALGIGGMILAMRLARQVREHPRLAGHRTVAGSGAPSLSSGAQHS